MAPRSSPPGSLLDPEPAPDSHDALRAFWAQKIDALLLSLETTRNGLSSSEAQRRLEQYGPNTLRERRRAGALPLLIAQFKSPIILILLFAAALSFFLRDPLDAAIIMVIIVISGLLGFWQEKGAANAVSRLLALVQVKSTVLRDTVEIDIPVEQLVPGDIVLLNAGDIVPADGRLLESKDLFVDEASMTGETFPAEKMLSEVPGSAALAERRNSVFLGTHVVSGTATIVVAITGKKTQFGKIAERLRLRPPETEFERGVRRFGYLLIELTLMLVLAMFAFNVYLERPVLDSLLFALALAVGLTPQLLPAIISVNLAHGAKRMAEQRVIVKRLASIENFGSMTVLCSDKTGTLTEGDVRLASSIDMHGRESSKVLEYAALNSHFQAGYTNPMDAAILQDRPAPPSDWRKLDEEPYDFRRRRMSVLVSGPGGRLLITKGAIPDVLAVCSRAEESGREIEDLDRLRAAVEAQVQELSARGLRLLGVAYRPISEDRPIKKEDEAGMTFLGLLSFNDPLKPEIASSIRDLKAAGVALKIITGDHHLVALEVSRQAGLDRPRWLTGSELRAMSNAALANRVSDIDVFAEVEPNQKERIILAMRKAGHVVGYMGDGINDAPALHAADVGISVAGAADVAKEAADIVLLEKDLSVLQGGIREGRTTFANTLKYVFMATSANFGNMFSMAGASLIVPFLPLLPKQILLVNLLTDLPEMTIATDRVDEEWTRQPHRWNLKFIRSFMITFGLLSSVFDFATFGVLLFVLRSSPGQFRSGWFVESVVSAALIVLVVRTPKSVLHSLPARPLLFTTLFAAVAAALLPFTPIAPLLGLEPLPPRILLILLALVSLYVLAAEATKRVFYRHVALS